MNRYFLYCCKLKTINGGNQIVTFRFTNLKKPTYNFPVNGKNFDRNVSTGYFYITSISFPTKWEMKVVEFYLPENFHQYLCQRIVFEFFPSNPRLYVSRSRKRGRRGEFRNLLKTRPYDANYECKIHSYSLSKNSLPLTFPSFLYLIFPYISFYLNSSKLLPMIYLGKCNFPSSKVKVSFRKLV